MEYCKKCNIELPERDITKPYSIVGCYRGGEDCEKYLICVKCDDIVSKILDDKYEEIIEEFINPDPIKQKACGKCMPCRWYPCLENGEEF